MKILNIILRILLSLILLLPILGTIGVFPSPTAGMYTPEGWAFIQALMNTGYMMPLIAILCAVCLVLVIMNRTAHAAALLAPFSLNVILFHVFLGGGVFRPDAILADALFLLNAYFLWEGRKEYQPKA